MADMIRSALDRCDAPTVERTAHGLKGIVAGFDAERCRMAAAAVETAAREQALDEAAEHWGVLECELSALAAELTDYLASQSHA